MKAGGVAIAAVTTATAALTTGIAAATGKTAEYGDNIDKMSQKMGMSAQAYQEWDAIMQHSGTSMETMKAGMKTLANAVESGNEAFQRIGLTQEQIASMSQEDLFAATISGLQNVSNETERTYLAGQLLGRGATELGALLNTSAEDTEAMRQRVHELGGVMSDDAVKASARYQDSLQDMQTAFSGLSRNMTAEFLPSIATVMDGLGNLFSGNGGLDQIKQGINEFAAKLGEELPKVAAVGGQILVAIGDAIVANLPVLIQSASTLIMTLANGLINQLPMLAQSSIAIIVALADGISQNLPTMIPTIVDVVAKIVETLISNADKLLEAALQIIIALAQGLISSLPKLLAKAPEIIAALVSAIIGAAGKLAVAAAEVVRQFASGIAAKFSTIMQKGREIVDQVKSGISAKFGEIVSKGQELVGKVGEGVRNAASGALNWGRELISNFIQGIRNAWESLKGGVTSVAGAIAGVFKHSVPKEGPFKRDDLWGAHLIENFAGGMLKEAPKLYDTAEGIAERVKNGMSIGDVSYAVNGSDSTSDYAYGGVTINVYGAKGQDVDALADKVMRKIYQATNRKVAFA